MKTCTKCLNSKSESEFISDVRLKSGIGSRCKLCIREQKTKYMKLWRENNKAHELEIRNSYRNKNREKLRRQALDLQKRHPERFRNYWAKQALALKNATPPWLTLEMKRQIRKFHKNKPNGMHVDHIIPIRGKNVSGLHVPWNLQYLTPEQNFKKSNKLEDLCP